MIVKAESLSLAVAPAMLFDDPAVKQFVNNTTKKYFRGINQGEPASRLAKLYRKELILFYTFYTQTLFVNVQALKGLDHGI